MIILICCLVLFQLSLQQCSEADQKDLVEIPDPNFLQALLDAGVDKNGDGQISEAEAEATVSIHLGPAGISDLTGIASFINLDTLEVLVNPISSPDLSENSSLKSLTLAGCGLTILDISKNGELRHLDCSGNTGLDNFLVSLDLSGNPLLESLICQGNELETLDISHNPLLKSLNCWRNRIAGLDLSANTALTELICKNNWLADLDLSNNPSLVKMISCGNRMSTLDISKNIHLTLIGIDNMPALGEVCVWTQPFPPAGVEVIMGFSPNVCFTTQCSEQGN